MSSGQLAGFGARPRPASAPNLNLTMAPDLARAGNQPKTNRAEKTASRQATSIGRLRGFYRSTARPGFCGPARSYHAHFLHALPLLWSNHHNKLGHKNIVL